MNQILITKNRKGFLEVDLKRVILFFVALLILFSIVVIGLGCKNLYDSAGKRALREPPKLTVQTQGSVANISISDEFGVNIIEYSWNDGSKIKYQGEGKKNVNMQIEMPQGKNMLAISVIDIEGNITNFEEKELIFDSNGEVVDNSKPTIIVERGSAAKKINIVVTDDTLLDYFVYKYGDDEEVRVNATEETATKIVQEIEAKSGSQKLIVTAYDKNGNTEKLETTITGTTGPKVSVAIQQKKYVVTVTDESSISKIEYSINGQEQTITDIPKKSKEYQFKVDMQEGIINNLKLKVYNEVNLITEKNIQSNGAVIKASIENGKFVANISSTDGLTKIEYTINDEKHTVNNLQPYAKEYKLELDLKEGENRIIINAYEDNLMTEYKGKKTM